MWPTNPLPQARPSCEKGEQTACPERRRSLIKEDRWEWKAIAAKIHQSSFLEP